MIYKILNFIKRIFGKRASVPAPTPIESPVVIVPPVATGEFKLFIPLKLYGLDFPTRRKKFDDAIAYAESRLWSKEFKDWFMAFKFTQLGHFENKTNEELFYLLMRPVKSNYYVINGTIFNRGVIGYNQDDYNTEGGDIYTYAAHYDSFEILDLVDHLTHEWLCHGNNFSHAYRYSPERDRSLPYAVGYFLGGIK